MNYFSMTDKAIVQELGHRIEQVRLEQNMTQQEVADSIGISRVSYGKLESGEAKFINIIATLRALGQLQHLDNFIPESTFSPLEMLKLKGKQRQRARPPKQSNPTTRSTPFKPTESKKNNDEFEPMNHELDW